MKETSGERIQPHLRSESGVRAINRFRVFLNQAPDRHRCRRAFPLTNAFGTSPFSPFARANVASAMIFSISQGRGGGVHEGGVAGFGDEDVVPMRTPDFPQECRMPGSDGDDHAGLERGARFARSWTFKPM